jgi:hypothetical protein
VRSLLDRTEAPAEAEIEPAAMEAAVPAETFTAAADSASGLTDARPTGEARTAAAPKAD